MTGNSLTERTSIVTGSNEVKARVSKTVEFGIAKHGYVKMRGGWFSDRSVCYLASGRPVLLQETGQSDWLPIMIPTFACVIHNPRFERRTIAIVSG